MSYIDPVKVSPGNYKQLFARGDVRIVKMDLKAGESDIEHSHPFEVVYFIKGGKARIYTSDGAAEVEVPDGHLMEHEAWTHRVENIGDTDIHAILVEFQS